MPDKPHHNELAKLNNRMDQSYRKARNKAVGWLISGIGVMFVSTLFQGLVGDSGRLAILLIGFGIMVSASIILARMARAADFRELIRPAAMLSACLAIMFLRDQSFEGVRGGSFLFIAVVYFLGGWLVAKTQQEQSLELPNSLLGVLLLILLGSLTWYRLANVDSAFHVGRIAGADDLNPVGVAYVTGVCLVLVAAIGLLSRGVLCATVAAITIPILILDFFGAASRGSAVGLFIAFSYLVYVALGAINNRITSRNMRWKLAAGSAILVAVFLYTAHSFLFSQSSLLLARFQTLNDPFRDDSTSERILIWQMYWEQFNQFWILGLPGYEGPYPHNLFFEMWLRFGLVGWLLIAATLYAVFKLVRLVWRRDMYSIDVVFSALFIFGLVNGQFNLSLEINRVFWVGFGYLLAREVPIAARRVARLPGGAGRFAR